jgi:hypothetical protein
MMFPPPLKALPVDILAADILAAETRQLAGGVRSTVIALVANVTCEIILGHRKTLNTLRIQFGRSYFQHCVAGQDAEL